MQLVERDASLEHFLVVDRDGLLGLVGLKGRADSRYFGPLPGGGYEAVGIVGQIAGRVAAFVLIMIVKPEPGPSPGIEGGPNVYT